MNFLAILIMALGSTIVWSINRKRITVVGNNNYANNATEDFVSLEEVQVSKTDNDKVLLVKGKNKLKKDEIIKLCKEMKPSGFMADFYYLEDTKYASFDGETLKLL